VTDYAIARKIVSYHCDEMEDDVDEIYTQEEVLRYITFARQFKPMISEVSHHYKLLFISLIFLISRLKTLKD
jgi:DNA replication licensing factor MCM6